LGDFTYRSKTKNINNIYYCQLFYYNVLHKNNLKN
jgi:hypothetical protein